MAGLAFRFAGRSSPLARWDIRFRVAATALVSASVLGAPVPALVPLTLLTMGLLAAARCTPGEVGRVVGSFAAFFMFFLGLGLAFEPTWDQAAFLGVQAARLVVLLLLGHGLFLAATPTEVTEGIRWYLGWWGPRRAWAAASMASWALASVPQTLDQASTLLEAAALRGLTVRRHPLRALNLLTLGLLVRTVDRAADLTAALEARSFGAAIPPSDLRARAIDGWAFAGVVLWCALSWAGGSILVP